MKYTLLVALLAVSLCSSAQTIDKYFESIRDNSAALTAFFAEMPKGGDLHNHFSGSVYAETYIDQVVRMDYVINTTTLQVKKEIPAEETNWAHFSSFNDSTRASFRQKLLMKWSVKDYNGVSYPSDKQFFETFSAFGIADDGPGRLDSGLMELKRRAVKERVSYIETMFTMVPCNDLRGVGVEYNRQLEVAQANRDEATTQALLNRLYQLIVEKNKSNCAKIFSDSVVTNIHNRLKMDDSSFTMRYQTYVVRVVPPVEVFKSLVLSFQSADTCPLVVGVNIVAPEDNQTSMKDYWLHMQMYKFCHQLFPRVKYAMHAGELTLGLVKPEDLNWHINEAVRTAGASRIGHGVDLAYEHDTYDLLKYMAKNDVAIEINLYSNEFILKVKGEDHPFSLYKEFNVPIVICTDDAGVLRSNLIHQYVLLAKRYKNVSYHDIKKYVYNSIDYSFIKEQSVKKKLKAQLNADFSRFEKEMLSLHTAN